MNKFATLSVMLCLGMVGCGEQDAQLTGKDAVLAPELQVPFISSDTFVRTGTRDAQSGGCLFDDDLTLDPGELAPGETKMRVRRGYDPVLCEELVEEGIVLESLTAVVEQVPTAVTAGQSYSATGKVAYLDTKSLIGAIVSPLLGGIDVSHVGATINLTSGDCRNSAPSASVGFSIGAQSLLGWTTSMSSSWSQVTCTNVVGEALVVHGNSGSQPLLYDCSEGASIEYSTFRMTMSMAGQAKISSSDRLRGDKDMCGENLVRVVSLN